MGRLPRALLLSLQLALLAAAGAPEAPVSAPRSLVWGPGLQAGVVLPVRYFYLQAVSSEGHNLTRSPPGSVHRGPPSPRRPLPCVPLRAPPPLARAPRESARRLRGAPPLARRPSSVWSQQFPSASVHKGGRSQLMNE